ncbi:hypothetical protein [Rubrolithibacter danxiaensis]|uniref:hypothetical protein n=1 Tax=Rubrolithibacter danxiaensis TaxID=3390805 RepID=UPI003BF8043F
MPDYSIEIERYKGLMEEIKRRIFAIEEILMGETSTGFPITDMEFIALQLTKILETMVLSHLISNPEEYIKQFTYLNEHRNAEHLLNKMSAINADFYPTPVQENEEPQALQANTAYLTKEEFITIYAACASLLNPTNPFSEPININEIRNFVQPWVQRIINLLNHHSIKLVDGISQLSVQMTSPEDETCKISVLK